MAGHAFSRMGPVTCFLVAAVLAVGCSSSAKHAQPVPTTLAATSSATATRFHVPLPPGARLGGRAGATADHDSTAFIFPSYENMVKWLDSNMPIGQDFGDWKWCAPTSATTPDGGYWRSYLHRPELSTSLVVASSEEKNGTGGLVVAVQDDDGGDC